jgi:hypothetical protein
MSFLHDLFWNYYQELGWVISGAIRCSGRTASYIASNRKQEMIVPKRRVAGGELFVQDEWDAFIFNHRYVCYDELLLSF